MCWHDSKILATAKLLIPVSKGASDTQQKTPESVAWSHCRAAGVVGNTRARLAVKVGR